MLINVLCHIFCSVFTANSFVLIFYNISSWSYKNLVVPTQYLLNQFSFLFDFGKRLQNCEY